MRFGGYKRRPDIWLSQAFSLLELLFVLGVLSVLGVLGFLVMKPRGGGCMPARTAASCFSHVRQVSIDYVAWSHDHDDRFPWQVPVSDGGSMEHVDSGRVAPHYHCITQYVVRPELLVCPTDEEKVEATNRNTVSAENISYFVSVQNGLSPADSLLIGDRKLVRNGEPVQPGLVTVTWADELEWDDRLHYQRGEDPVGAMTFLDGHAELVDSDELEHVFRRSGVATHQLIVP